MTENDAKNILPSILDEAAAWQVKLSSGAATDDDVEQHMEWLLADPQHIEADEILAASMKVSSEFEAAARTAFSNDFEVAKPSEVKESLWERLFSSLTIPQYGLAAAAVAAMLIFSIIPSVMVDDIPGGTQIFAANGSNVENISLADGSEVALFGGSEISVTMEPSARIIELKQGRAFFGVTSNKERPFYVNTGSRQVRVVGTRFEVLRSQDFERVSVNEGLVSVDVLNSQLAPEVVSSPILIEPGMVAFYGKGERAPVLSRREPSTIGAWSNGVLTYKEASLGDVVVAINDLFPETRIQLADEMLASVAFSGTLVVSSAEQMARQLGEFLSLDVKLEGGGVVTLVSR